MNEVLICIYISWLLQYSSVINGYFLHKPGEAEKQV